VAVVAAVGLGLTGCSDPGTPSDTLPTAASTSAEPTLAPLGPADFPVPAEAREQTEAGAIAAATYYINLIDHLFAAAEAPETRSEWLRSLSSECATCTQFADRLDSQIRSGERNEGADSSFEAEPSVNLTDASASLAYILSVTPGRTLDATGNVTSVAPATRLNVGQLLTWDASKSAWITNDLQVEPIS
jgi:hypothetical protein